MSPILIDENEEPIQCGKEAAKNFAFAKGYRNLNHGKSCQTIHTTIADV
jgi:hypothetical protein